MTTAQNEDSNSNCDHTKITCGVGRWRPRWLQPMANPMMFLFILSLVAIAKGMANSMPYSLMSTIEKRYSFDSKISSIHFFACDICSMLVSPIVGYYGVRFNRPKLIGYGQLILSFSCILASSPYFIYGPVSINVSYDSNSNLTYTNNHHQICSSSESKSFQSIDCNLNNENTVWPAVIILFIANFLQGIGITIFFVIGMPFIDDNVSKGSSPMFLSIIQSIILIGPVFGFTLSALCLNMYEDPWNDPGFSHTDPRFIGAWWLGYIVVAVLLAVTSLPMFLFPAQFSTATTDLKILKTKMKQSGGTLEAIRRFIKNPLVILFFFGNTFRYLGNSGFYQLFTKYLETHYRQTSSNASLILGSASILPISIGIILGGLWITWFRPNARLLFIWIFLAELSTAFFLGSGLLFGCNPINLNGIMIENEQQLELKTDCMANCTTCSTRSFEPICDPSTRITYFSPCHAGCTSYDATNLTFSSCSCLSQPNFHATNGYCTADMDCPYLKYFLLLIVLEALISATAKTGNSLITFRTVEPMDKSFTNGVLSSLLSISTFIPGTLLYGYIADSVCLVWESKCGKRGNCWVYDQDRFRWTYIGISVLFLLGGSCFDFIMIFYSDRIKNMYDDDDIVEVNDNGDVDGRVDAVEMN